MNPQISAQISRRSTGTRRCYAAYRKIENYPLRVRSNAPLSPARCMRVLPVESSDACGEDRGLAPIRPTLFSLPDLRSLAAPPAARVLVSRLGWNSRDVRRQTHRGRPVRGTCAGWATAQVPPRKWGPKLVFTTAICT